MTLEERKEYLQKVYRAAFSAGLCRTMKDFANQLGVERTGLSSAMNGRENNLTDSLIMKVERYALLNHLEDAQPQAQQQPQQQGVWIPPETLELYNNIAATCRNLSEILKRNLE